MRKLLTLGLAALLLAIPVAASAQEAYTTRTVNVRAGPDTSYPPVAALGGGAPVQVMGCLDDWSWCDVVFGDNRGWVYAPYLNYVYQGARVPFYTYAPSFGIPIISFSLGSYWDRYYRGRPWYGRRDYWQSRAPQHVRPSGPPPRATAPTFRERSENQGNRAPSGPPAYTGNRGSQPSGDNRPSREGGVPSRDYRSAQGAPSAGPQPPVSRPPQDMRRASPAQQGGPPPSTNQAPRDVRRASPTQQGGPPPSTNQAPQDMRRASPTQQSGAPPAVREGGPRGGEKSRASEGDKGGKPEDKR
jgi:uncharacterized protein YraI